MLCFDDTLEYEAHDKMSPSLWDDVLLLWLRCDLCDDLLLFNEIASLITLSFGSTFSEFLLAFDFDPSSSPALTSSLFSSFSACSGSPPSFFSSGDFIDETLLDFLLLIELPSFSAPATCSLGTDDFLLNFEEIDALSDSFSSNSLIGFSGTTSTENSSYDMVDSSSFISGTSFSLSFQGFENDEDEVKSLNPALLLALFTLFLLHAPQSTCKMLSSKGLISIFSRFPSNPSGRPGVP